MQLQSECEGCITSVFFINAGELRHWKQLQRNAGGLDVASGKYLFLSEDSCTSANEHDSYFFPIYRFLPVSKTSKFDSQGPFFFLVHLSYWQL